MPDKYSNVRLLLEEFALKINSSSDYKVFMDTNFYENINKFDSSIDTLFGQYKDLPIYIVSAGPSLDKNINDLKNIMDFGVILSVGRAVKPLIEAGIDANYVIVTESSPLLYDMQLKDVKLN